MGRKKGRGRGKKGRGKKIGGVKGPRQVPDWAKPVAAGSVEVVEGGATLRQSSRRASRESDFIGKVYDKSVIDLFGLNVRAGVDASRVKLDGISKLEERRDLLWLYPIEIARGVFDEMGELGAGVDGEAIIVGFEGELGERVCVDGEVKSSAHGGYSMPFRGPFPSMEAAVEYCLKEVGVGAVDFGVLDWLEGRSPLMEVWLDDRGEMQDTFIPPVQAMLGPGGVTRQDMERLDMLVRRKALGSVP